MRASPTLIACLSLLLSGAALAAAPAPSAAPKPAVAPMVAPEPPPDWFEVELIVFRNTQPGAGASETWPADPGRPAVEQALEIGSEAAALAGASAVAAAAKAALLAAGANAGSAPVMPASSAAATSGSSPAYNALPPTSSRLTAQWDKLVKSSRYEPIGYFAWVQPPLDRTAAQSVRIASPLPPAPPSAAPSATPATDPPFAFASPQGVTPLPPPLPPLRVPLDGTATVGLARYLYLTLDLEFQPGDLPPLADGTPAPPFRLIETRKMRSKDLHYFDHPLFGVIALITPRPAPTESAPLPPNHP